MEIGYSPGFEQYLSSPVFAGPLDLHLDPAYNGALNNSCPALVWITDDIDGQPRAAMTGYGADEFAPTPRLSSETQESQATLDVYPNPFESTIKLYVTVSKDSKVSLSLYNMLGLKI